jgi:predicted nucleic acid-binding protein
MAMIFTSLPAFAFDEVAEGRRFYVPVLWFFEIANALLVLRRRKKITPKECAAAGRALASLHPAVDEEEPRVAFGKVSELALEQSLSVYDAAYLELALRRGLPLASRHVDLNSAAQQCGVRVLL